MRTLRAQGRTGWVVAGVGVLLAASACTVASATAQAAGAGRRCTKVAFEFKAPGQLASEAVLAGANQVAAAYGFCSPSYRAPPTAVDAMEQVAAIKADVKAGDKVVLLSADDPFLPGPALRAAMKAGVKVVTFGSGADVPGARDFFVQDVAYNTLAQVVVNAVVEAEGPQAELGVMTMTPDALPQVSWLGAVQSYAETHHLTVKTVEWLPFASPLTSVEDMVRTYPGLRAVLALDEAAIAGAAQAVTDLHRAGKVAVFGIGDPAPLRRFFANGSLRALFGWDEVAEGELLICLAKLAYEGEVHPGGAFSCHHGPEGSWAVTAKDNPGTGATRGTVIFSQPLEFTPENYKSYGF